jgi:hypothetical protein
MKRFTKFMAACVLFASSTASAELVTNGGFETPAIPDASALTITSGAEPAGFAWTVTQTNVEIKRQGYVGGGGTKPFNGAPYEGLQSLDLDGFPSASAISQTLSTTPGTLYALNFAYANNPYRVGPALATVYV